MAKQLLCSYLAKGIRCFKRGCLPLLTGVFAACLITFLIMASGYWKKKPGVIVPDLKVKNPGVTVPDLEVKVPDVIAPDLEVKAPEAQRPPSFSVQPLRPSIAKWGLPVMLRWDGSPLRLDNNITCGSQTCVLTNNPDVLHQYDILAVSFYGAAFAYNQLPVPRKPGHLWTLVHNESPKHNFCQFCDKDAMTLFNITSTFKRESDYPIPTMWLLDPRDLDSLQYVISIKQKNQYRREGLAPVVFIHSDCNNPSDREHYMRLLQQHIQIDSYGKCEHNKDFKNGTNLMGMSLDKYTSTDLYKLIAKYKFAFAIENFICDDYITEKFWRPLQLGVVPIVFGSPKIKMMDITNFISVVRQDFVDDYLDFAPSNHSIIDIRDFRSVKEVADYVTFLDTDDDEYAKYLSFKQTGITNPKLRSHLAQRDWGGVGKKFDTFFNGFDCFICNKLHTFLNQVISGQGSEQFQAKGDHYSCPVPKMFDGEGRYVTEGGMWKDAYVYASYFLRSIRFHINNNLSADFKKIHDYARQLKDAERSRSGLT